MVLVGRAGGVGLACRTSGRREGWKHDNRHCIADERIYPNVVDVLGALGALAINAVCRHEVAKRPPLR
jgi:hypothetical protein